MIFYYVRHGEPIYNPDSLTEYGHAQAEALVARMKVCCCYWRCGRLRK